jgi:hypothetical protein
MNDLLKNSLVAAAGVAVVSTAAIATNSISSAVAAIGGATFGTLCIRSEENKKARKREEAIRVATAFKSFYERNKGVIVPEEISFFADIDLPTATVFLDALAESQNGQKLSVNNTVAYAFPHTENVLDTLTKNSQAWVESRTQPVLAENQALKQQIMMIQAQMQAQAMAKQQMPAYTPEPQVVQQTPSTDIDPWKNLL